MKNFGLRTEGRCRRSGYKKRDTFGDKINGGILLRSVASLR